MKKQFKVRIASCFADNLDIFALKICPFIEQLSKNDTKVGFFCKYLKIL